MRRRGLAALTAIAVFTTGGAAALRSQAGGTLVMGQSTATTHFNNAVGSGTGIMIRLAHLRKSADA